MTATTPATPSSPPPTVTNAGTPTVASVVSADVASVKATVSADVATVESKVTTFVKKYGPALIALVVGLLVGRFVK